MIGPTLILDGVKSLSYAANMLASRLARERGFDEALLVSPEGHVLEAPTSSFFWIKDEQVFTPPLSQHILASITRRVVMEEADAAERSATLQDVQDADEAFIASTTREVQPVAAIDDRSLSAASRYSPSTACSGDIGVTGAAARPSSPANTSSTVPRTSTPSSALKVMRDRVFLP